VHAVFRLIPLQLLRSDHVYGFGSIRP